MPSTTATLTDVEKLSPHFPIHRVDLTALLPAGWRTAVAECAARRSTWTTLDGRSTTSREADFGYAGPFSVGLVPGDVLADELPDLMVMYRTIVLGLANRLGPGRYVTSSNPRSSVNVNSIPYQSRYEWHVDSNPLTGLLFATDHPRGTGGELVFRPDPRTRPGERWELTVRPVAGELLLFDGRRAAHTVLPVGTRTPRISVPMNFYLAGEPERRPDDLDGYLYAGTPAEAVRDASRSAGTR